MMTMIQTLYRFNRWANRRLLETAVDLSQDEFDRDLGGSFPSLRSTLLHLFWVEMLFLGRWRGLPTTDLAEPPNLDTIALIEGLWDDLETARAGYLAQLSDGDLHKAITYTDTRGRQISIPLWQSLSHLVNHSTFHRGQIASKLRQLGRTPPATDFVLFCRERT